MKLFPSVLILAVFTMFFTACRKTGHQASYAKKYSNEVAVEWIQLQQKLIKTTAGFGPGMSSRSFAYSGLTMYEAIVPGMPAYQSVFLQLQPGSSFSSYTPGKEYYWPASVNAALARIIKNIFASTAEANLASIDSLETSFAAKFEKEASTYELQRSIEYGQQVADMIFEWSKTDGTLDVHPPYEAPVGFGLWVPTTPAFGPPVNPYGGKTRPMVPDLLSYTKAPAPIAYSENPSSDFYKMVKQVYTISKSLTTDEINIAKTWGDVPGNYNGPAHFTNVVTQLVVLNKLPLDETALLYAKHGIAINDAAIPTFKTKYEYNVVRPVTYIHNIFEDESWHTVIPTPAHPEYLAAHAVTAQSSAEVLKAKFGKSYCFVDRTHDALYGPRSYSTFDGYAKEAGWSRVLAGIHYKPTVDVSLGIGRRVGQLVNQLKFKK